MSYRMVILITPRTDLGHQIATAWEKAGSSGVTFIESYGMRRIAEAIKDRAVAPGLFSMFELIRSRQQTSLVLITVIEEAQEDEMIGIAESLLGDLGQPNVGVLFVLDLARTIGLREVES